MVEHGTGYIRIGGINITELLVGTGLLPMDIRNDRNKPIDKPMRILTGIAVLTALTVSLLYNDNQDPIGSPTLTIQPTATATLERTMTPDTTPTSALLKSINLP